MSIISVENVSKIFGEKKVLSDVSLGIEAGEKIGVIGINGTGKSTFLRIIAGELEADSGEIIKKNNLFIVSLKQNPEFRDDETILEYVVDGNNDDWAYQAEAKNVLGKLGINDYDKLCVNLSGGEKKKLALCQCIIKKADVLILDEPTNHLDYGMVTWLEDYLIKYKGTVIMVTHDRYFLDRVTKKIVELDRGNLYTYESNYSGFLELKNKRIEEMISSEKKRQNLLRIETEWVRRGCQARTTKQKARLQRYEELKDKKAPKLDENVQMDAINVRLGRKTIEINNISKEIDGKVLINDFTYYPLRADRVGIVGENGCGKSTLLKIINGMERPDSGNVEVGETVKIGYFSQEPLDMINALPEEKVIDYIRDVAEFIDTKQGKVSASQMLERFLFDGPMQWTQLSKLSGGEMRRLQLLRVIMDSPNVLILDEPTNDLDIATLAVLEDFLNGFSGIVIAVSHDRYFLDNMADRILAFEGNGHIERYDGNYTDYAEKTGVFEIASGAKKSIKSGGAADASANVGGNSPNNENRKPAKLKFTYKEQKEFETIEDDIAKLEETIDEKKKEINKSATDFVKLCQLSEEVEKLEEELMSKMERWEYLTELAEKIAKQ